MTPGRPRYVRWAAWLGVVALAINALVPVHIAFDLATAFGAAHEHSVLAELSGHHAGSHSHQHGKPQNDGNGADPTACPVCPTLATLAGFAPAPPIALPLPPPAAIPAAVAEIDGIPADIPLAYRSRAPPVA